MFSLPDALLILGGLAGIAGGEVTGNKHIQWLDTSNATSKWVQRPDLSGLDLGGMISCTVHPINGLYYCNLGSDAFFVKDETRFVSFNPSTLAIRALTLPPIHTTHSSMVADPIRQRVLLLSYQERTPTALHVGMAFPDIHHYDIASDSWNVVDPVGRIDQRMPSMSARAFYHHPSTLYGFMAGGQHNALWCVTDLVYKFSLSQDPTDRSLRFERWSRLPLQAGFGAVLDEVPPGSGQLLYVGGSKSVGPSFSHDVFYWDQSQDPNIHAIELERRTKEMEHLPQPQLKVVKATYGFTDVTDAVQKLVDEGWTSFSYYLLPDLGLWEELQWKDGWQGHVVTKKSTGKSYRTGVAKELLTVHIHESDGRVRMHICPSFAGCRFSFLFEEEERMALVDAWNGTMMPIDLRDPPKVIF